MLAPNKCEYCGNQSDLRDGRGNCIACGAPRPTPPREVIMPNWRQEQHPVTVAHSSTMFWDSGSLNININKIYTDRYLNGK